MVDQDGTHYLDAGDPAVGATSRARAREEELKREVLVQLDWIEGVSVSVQLPRDAAPAESAPPPVPDPSAPEAPVASASATGLEPAPPEPSIGLNQPLELDPGPADAAARPPPRRPPRSWRGRRGRGVGQDLGAGPPELLSEPAQGRALDRGLRRSRDASRA